ncbi:MAG: TIGR00725 family protein [candidate division Zixibacteria bacterium]|nr:TIGR00725 family protein [candidate division Zixibacteria bacterium]
MGTRRPLIAVCGAGEPSAETVALAEAVGTALAERGAVVLCGGLGGVMDACCRAAKSAGGLTVGVVPGTETSRANAHVDVPIASGMSHGRNAIIVHSAGAVIALPGSYGTLSEIALALADGKTVFTLGDTWDIPGAVHTDSVEAAVTQALAAAAKQEHVERSV